MALDGPGLKTRPQIQGRVPGHEARREEPEQVPTGIQVPSSNTPARARLQGRDPGGRPGRARLPFPASSMNS